MELNPTEERRPYDGPTSVRPYSSLGAEGVTMWGLRAEDMGGAVLARMIEAGAAVAMRLLGKLGIADRKQ